MPMCLPGRRETGIIPCGGPGFSEMLCMKNEIPKDLMVGFPYLASF